MPSRSRDWEALSAGQKNRYLGYGRTHGMSPENVRQAYESGRSLAALRGHARTPERPERARARPERYPEYRQRPGGKAINVLVKDRGIVRMELFRTDRGRVAKHWNAIKHYLETGETRRLYRWEGKTVGEPPVELEARTNVIDDLAITHDLEFESIYEEIR